MIETRSKTESEANAVSRPELAEHVQREHDIISGPYSAYSEGVRQLAAAIDNLSLQSQVLQLPRLEGRPWYESLSRKLLPQLGDDPYLIAAVVGGTNIGKSVIFNHLAGSRVSATSPLASGTKHPVCLVPLGFNERHDLGEIFQSFELHPWANSEAALENHPEHRLFWQPSPQLPQNLLILDTPDIDSDSQVNWTRAEHILHCADVLIAVLTQQKYNDAAVKQFFRKAAAEDKAVIIVFNQCLLPEDEDYWPLWLSTFTRETGVKPERVYLAPNDRRSAEANHLPFFLRPWLGTADAPTRDKGPGTGARKDAETPRDLREDMARLHFAEIKIRTLRGSLQQILSPATGIPAYLQEVRNRSADFKAASMLLNGRQLARIQNWPLLPHRLLVREIRHWWRTQRAGVTRTVHEFYNTVTEGVTVSYRWIKQHLSGPDADPLELYRQQEKDVLLAAIERLYEGLTDLSELGNELLRPRLAALLGGERRAYLIEQILSGHADTKLDEEVRDAVSKQMQIFRDESPQIYEFLKRLDFIAAMAHPMTSVVLLFAGGGPLGDAVAPIAHDAVAQLALHVATGTGAVIAGETAISGTTGGIRALEAKFRQLQNAFTARRIGWLAAELQMHLLGSLQADLQTAVNLPSAACFIEVESRVKAIQQQVGECLET